MNKKYFIAVFFALSLFISTGFAKTIKNDSTADSVLTKILNAVENNDINNFVADGDSQFKAAISKQMFEGVNAMIAPRMKKGYEVVPLGTLNQQGCQVYLMKLAFKDGGDDILVKLALRGGKVAGFLFQ